MGRSKLALRKRVFGHMRTAKAQIRQSDQGRNCPLTELLNTTECMNGGQMPNEAAHVQDDLNPHILCMLEGTFFLKRPNYM